MRGGSPAWVKGIGIGLAVLLLSYSLVALQDGPPGHGGRSRCTTYGADEGGCLALYRWLRGLGIPVERWEADLRALPSEATVLLVVGPEVEPGRGEIPAIREWVRAGGTLVVAADPKNPFSQALGLGAGAGQGRERKGIEPVLPGPYTRGVRSILVRSAPSIAVSRPESVVHAAGPRGAVLVEMTMGKGRVIALTIPEILTNGEMRKGDHARLALNVLLAHLGSGTLLVDEYHHGYGRVSSIAQYLGRSVALAPLAQGTLAILLLVALWARRFGPARPMAEELRRSSMEYVRSMGGLLHRAQARGLALESTVQWVEEEARRMHVEGDRVLQAALRSAKARAGESDLTDRDLLRSVTGLYRVLEGACRKAR